MYVCVTCRVGGKGIYPNCSRDGHDVRMWGKRTTIPKKNNKRAWKRIENGELLWNRRKTKGYRAQVVRVNKWKICPVVDIEPEVDRDYDPVLY